MALKVKYLKENINEKGMRETKIQNKIPGIKYLGAKSDAKTMLRVLDEKLFDFGKEFHSNLIGFTHDFASSLTGEYNGLSALIKKKNPNHHFMDLDDPCHALNLVLTKPLDFVPDELTSFIDRIHNHYISPQRVSYLTNLQIQKNYTVLSLKHYAKTRWLSLGQSLERLLIIWNSIGDYMRLKPPFSGVRKVKYTEFSNLLENKIFKLQIVFLAGITGKINNVNVKFQDQSLEVQHLKIEINRIIKYIAQLCLIPSQIPKDFKEFKKEGWTDLENQPDKLLSTEQFIANLESNLDSRLADLANLDAEEKEKFIKTFRSFLIKILNMLIHYLPFDDSVVETLDFLTLNFDEQEITAKINAFNTKFKIIPEEKQVELTEEISKLMEENILLLMKRAKKSSLQLWDLILDTGEQDPKGGSIYHHLSKIFEIAHSLPTSSAGIEQSFSTVKLTRNVLRSNLKEQTVQSLLLIRQEFQNSKYSISDEMIHRYDKIKMELNQRKRSGQNGGILIEVNPSTQTQGNNIVENNEAKGLSHPPEASGMTSSSKKRKSPEASEEKPDTKCVKVTDDFPDLNDTDESIYNEEECYEDEDEDKNCDDLDGEGTDEDDA